MSSLNLLAPSAVAVAAGYRWDASWPAIIAAWLLLYALNITLVPLAYNYWVARKSGLPWVVVPWDPHHFVWMVVQVPMNPYMRKWLPTAIWSRLTLACYAWEFHERQGPYQKFAAPQGNPKSLMLVSFSMPEFYTWDAEMVTQILARPSDFQVPKLTEYFMDRFGKSLVTTNGDVWARQRKVIAGVINERISQAVFRETVSQTTGLLDELFSAKLDRVADTNRLFDMLRKVTIHVLSGAGMGESVAWEDKTNDTVKPGYRTSYITSCKMVTTAVAGPIILPSWFLDHYPTFLPGHDYLHNLSHAIREFPIHTRELLDKERERASHGGAATSGNIMSQLLQASDSASQSGKKSLHESEIMGNLFIFTVAGFDTTANTLSYSMMMLARYPEWQDWLLEEVDAILPAGPIDVAALEYTKVFPQATRILAFMFEVLRFFTPVVHISRETKAPQVIQTSKATYHIPAGCSVYADSVGLHLNPEVWRNVNIQEHEQPADDDELRFRPSRWLNRETESTRHFQPPRGSYIPWSGGPRICPGQKMAQVEYTAVLLMLLHAHRIEAAPVPGESKRDTERRLDAQMRRSSSLLTLQMNGVYDVANDQDGFMLRLTRRA